MKLSQLWQNYPKDMISNTSSPLLLSYWPCTDFQWQLYHSSCPCFLTNTLNTHNYKIFCSFSNIIKVKNFLTVKNLSALWKKKNEVPKNILHKINSFPLCTFFLFLAHRLQNETIPTESSSDYIILKSICFTIRYFVMVLNSSKIANKIITQIHLFILTDRYTHWTVSSAENELKITAKYMTSSTA